MRELEHFDAFELVSNEMLTDAYSEAVLRGDDPDLELLQNEMVKRGLLGVA